MQDISLDSLYILTNEEETVPVIYSNQAFKSKLLQEMLKTEPVSGKHRPSLVNLRQWRRLEPRSLQFYDHHWNKVNKGTLLFHHNFKFESWESDEPDGKWFCEGIIDPGTGQPHGIVRKWQDNGQIWEYSINQGKISGICLQIGYSINLDRPHTLLQMYEHD